MCTLNENDLIMKEENKFDIIHLLHDSNRKSHEIVAFDNYIFGIAYVDRDYSIYATFLRNGI